MTYEEMIASIRLKLNEPDAENDPKVKEWMAQVEERVRHEMMEPETRAKFEQQLAERMAIEMDRIIYGQCYYKELDDGTVERIPPEEWLKNQPETNELVNVRFRKPKE
jgi:hypothetical protein